MYDVDAERFLAEVRDAHPRAPHALATATASAAVPQSGRAVDLVVSAAACDGVKLWDLRQTRSVPGRRRGGEDVLSVSEHLSISCYDRQVRPEVLEPLEPRPLLWRGA